MSRFKELIHDSKLMSGIYSITLITALLILALVIKGPEESGKLVADRNGSIVGINRRSLDRSERYDLSINVEDGDTSLTRDVTLTLQASRSGDYGVAEDKESRQKHGQDDERNTVEYSRLKGQPDTLFPSHQGCNVSALFPRPRDPLRRTGRRT